MGNFRASDHGLIVGTFSYSGESEDDIGMNITTIEEFLGHSPVPVYLGQKYTDKLKLQITLVKNPCIYNNMHFYEHECRSLLRIITGKKGYQWLKLINNEFDDDLWYRAKVNNILYKRIDDNVVGIILSMECDSCFAWSKEHIITIRVNADKHFYIYNNTDDLQNYVYPIITVAPCLPGDISLINISDNNWNTEIRNIKESEKVTINCASQIISSNRPHDMLLNDFNLGWVRLVPDKNEYVCNVDATICIRFRVPRKVGVVYAQEEDCDMSKHSETHVPIPIQKIESLFSEDYVPGSVNGANIWQDTYPEHEPYSDTHVPITIPKIENALKD